VKSKILSILVLSFSISGTNAIAEDLKVQITRSIASVDVMHKGKKVTIKRN